MIMTGLSIVLTVLGAGLILRNGVPLLEGFRPQVVIAGIAFPAIGGLLAIRVPGNRVGWIVLAGSLCWAVSLFSEQYAWFVTFTDPSALPGGDLAAWVQTWIWVPGTVLLLTALPLVFPDGQLPSPRWRWIAWLVVIGAVIATSAQLLVFWPPADAAASLLGKSDIDRVTPGLLGVLHGVGNVLTSILGPLVGATAVIVRLRRSVGVERQQMRWFAYAIAVLVITLIFDSAHRAELGWTLWIASTLGIILVPVALGVAILRYRLYDIDRVISRTLGYAIVSLPLVLVFVGVVLGLTAVFEPFDRRDTVAVAASTLDRRASSSRSEAAIQVSSTAASTAARYDGQRVVDGFARQLRDEVDLGPAGASLLATADGVVRPVSASIWLRSGEVTR